MADNKERPLRILADKDIGAQNLERILSHYDELLRTIQTQIDVLKDQVDDLIERVATLEATP